MENEMPKENGLVQPCLTKLQVGGLKLLSTVQVMMKLSNTPAPTPSKP